MVTCQQAAASLATGQYRTAVEEAVQEVTARWRMDSDARWQAELAEKKENWAAEVESARSAF